MTDYTFWLIVWSAAAAGLLLAGCWPVSKPRNRRRPRAQLRIHVP